MKKKIFRFIYYSFGRYLPTSAGKGFIHVLSRKIRYELCSHIFESIGKNVNIERGAVFGSGDKIRIGDNSGIGINAFVPNGSTIGNDVMMGPNCFIHQRNHDFSQTDIPMRLQGFTESKPIIIEDDVWIGRNVTIMIGRHIKRGTIVAANSVVTKDFPPYSIIGGNPAKVIRNRLQDNK